MDNKVVMQMLSGAIRVYVVVALATIVVLALLAVAVPREAPVDAWVHAGIVAVVALLLPLRLRSARAGKRSGLRAVGLISAALLLVNVLGVTISGLYPTWMRVEMAGISVLMAVAVLSVIRLALERA